ncbi:hypothetical protein A2690_03845 [Candidatus Roizmanbacteria bacterium RIFCSPHIGHO2_01_FULL_39_12b]|uniref:Uncharacterized protein n=1 Tax=Candidatus Roizmanbacteria bacterium RIFCSPHIGHO2_01_FULL_39_12b TaxID=1802030 RepID=A0A1F7GC16_9BACT|nr:MAG: hypothetical protein A2690_03845 [Candidatus Roizmanbacteria bacterium RIFCSPHIGHO2_01_FULL_39_12b]OGK47073.1 MAG: hypothetical protein A3B46_01570 [Candidatus Roizmanbacteria bacterium RIFCSPLOWO2_01_FULL_39_19]
MSRIKPTDQILFLAGFLASNLIIIGNFVLSLIALLGSASINLISLLQEILSASRKAIVEVLKKFIKQIKKILKFLLKKEPKQQKVKVSKKKSQLKTRIVFFTAGVVFAGFAVMIYSGYSFINSLPNPRLIGLVNYPVSTQILDRKGRLLYEIHSDQNRTPIKIKQLPDYVWQSTIAIEDKNFFSHNGISIVNGILRAAADSIKTGHIQGGSTITQQLIKTALLTPERTINRKAKEIILALWAETVYSKKQILEMYLNQVPYGGASYGIEAASQTFFGKSASSLSIAQAAFLAGLPQAPSSYSPYTDPKLALRRRNEVLKAMSKTGYISNSQYDLSRQEVINVKDPNTFIKAPHFVFFVRSYLEKLFGTRMIEEGGLRVTTTLDLDLQSKVEEILKEELDSLLSLNVTNGGVVITQPETGEILTMVGSRDYFKEPYGSYNVTTANRQPGSSIKPIMYSLALQRGYTASSIIEDGPVVFNTPGSPLYKPVNYDGRYHGKVPLRYALANSYNIPAVKVLNTLGVANFVNYAASMGLSTLTNPKRYGLSITLGGGEVKLVDMAVAYGVFANYGKRVELDPVINVVDFQGRQLYQSKVDTRSKNVLPDSVAFIISNILSDNKARENAFGTNSQLEISDHTVAVKTGTTNSKRDNLTIGYTRSLLAAVWVGNNDNSPMDPQLTSGVTGAAPIWRRVMTYILGYDLSNEFVPKEGFYVPDSVVEKKCFYNRPEFFIKGTEETVNCQPQQLNSPTISPQ